MADRAEPGISSPHIGNEVSIERVLLGHTLAEVIYDCR